MEDVYNLDDYVINLKKYIKQNTNLKEKELIMQLYLDLGMKFKFDQDFFFGGNKKQKSMYIKAAYYNELHRCFESRKITCKSAAYIMEYILKRIGVNIITIEDPNDSRKYKHFYNIIRPKDGSEEYRIDLQDDMINMHFHARTKEFGLAIDESGRYIISLDEQKQMHTRLGYISKTNPYVDDYIYLLKQHLPLFDNFYSKIDFVLKNIDPIKYPNVDYWERRWKHDRLLKELFSYEEISKKLNSIEFYKKDESENKKFINGFFVNAPEGVITYLYSTKSNMYNSYNLSELALKVKNEKIEYRQNIKGLKPELNKLKNEQSLSCKKI